MKKIDWYILKKLLFTFIFCLLLFTVIAVAIDSSEKSDDFVRANFSTSEIINKYYLGFVPYIWSLLFPLFVFIAVIFFTSRMASRSEIIAILASGTSYNRFLRSYLVGGLLLAAVLWVGSRYWIPRANGIRSFFQTNYVDKNDATKNRITGNILTVIPEEEDDDGNVTQEEGVDIASQTFRRSYTNWLPSLTIRYEPVRNIVLRAAGYKSLVRPKLSQLAPRAVIEDNEGEFGNPDLKPYQAWNADASIEYYFGRNAALSAGFFYKDIKDYVVQTVSADVLYNGVTLDQATTFVNGDSAKVKGIELSYSQAFDFLPAPFDGLLTQLNYTYTDATGTVFTDGDASDPRKIPLMSSSKHTFNAVLGYEKGPLSLRIAGSYRDKYLDEVGDDASSDRYVSDLFQLDLSAKYRILPGVRLSAEWVNATNAPYFAYQNLGGSRRLLQYEEYSWTAKFGISASF